MDINPEVHNAFQVIINGGIIYYPTDIFGYVIPFYILIIFLINYKKLQSFYEYNHR